MAETAGEKRPVVPADRRRLILELLREQGSISVLDVEERFGVSPMTARRDLAMLAEAGYVRRTHGGAILPELAAHEDSFQSRIEQDTEIKVSLAKAVAAALAPEETIFLDSSSSAYYVAREILEIGIPLTLLTNSLPVLTIVGAAELAHIELVGLGGTYRKLTHSFVGAETVHTIERHLVDRVIFSVKGIEPEGFLTDPDALESDVKRAMITHARAATLVAAPQKFDQRGLNIVAPATAVDEAYLATPPATGVRTLEAAGIELHRV